MILTTHALVGAALGKNISNPWLIAIIAIPLHYLMDAFRHGEYLNKQSTFKNTWWKVVLDLVIGLSFVGFYILFSHPNPQVTRNILLGTFLSMFPDLLTVLYWKLHFKFLSKAFKFNEYVHSFHSEESMRWNLKNARNDIIFSLIAIILILF